MSLSRSLGSEDDVRWRVLFLLGLLACEAGGMTSERRLSTSAAITGRVLHQFDGTPIVGATVKFGAFPQVVTQGDGRFTIGGEIVTTKKLLTISGPGILTRKAYTASAETDWGVLPSSFNQIAFNDIGRQFAGGGTYRWMQAPTVYIDTRPRGSVSTSNLPKWIGEVALQAPDFAAGWSTGLYIVEPIVTANPPALFTPGTIIIHFSQLASDYGGYSNAIGYARWRATSNGTLTGGGVWLKYNGYSSNPTKRMGILAHELGHTFGYSHMDGSMLSMMQPSIGSKFELKPFDHLSAAFMYDRPPYNTAPDTEASVKKLGPAAAADVYWEGE